MANDTIKIPSTWHIWVYQNYTGSGLHLAKFTWDTTKTTNGFIKLSAKPSYHLGLTGCQGSGKLTTKLVSSPPELWSPTLDLAWFLNNYTPNTRKHSLLCYTVPHAMPSLPVLFKVCKEDWSVRFLHTLGLSSKSRLHFHSSNQFRCQKRMYTQLSWYWD